MHYSIPAFPVIFEEEIKRSRFITYLAHTEGLEETKAFLAEVKALHPHARHWCWASVAKAPNDFQGYGFSDDGEPNGTAGKPMLACLQGSNVGEITAVVVRYFGGTLLGTGGLVRAYSGGVSQALKQLETLTKMIKKRYALSFDYGQISLVQTLCQRFEVEILEQDFQERVNFTLGVSSGTLSPFAMALNEQSSGQLQLIDLENKE